MPQIDTTLLPTYAAQGLTAIAVNSGRRTAFATESLLQYDLSFPVALDMESEVFRDYRVPGHVFPLHIVVNRGGQVVHVSTGELAETEASIAAAVAE